MHACLMAFVRGEGCEFPIVFDVQQSGVARISSHLLHVRFKFIESSIYMEEEIRSNSGVLQQTVPIEKTVDEGGDCWYLPVGNFRAYGLLLSLLALSAEIPSRHSETSTVDMPSCSRDLSAIGLLDAQPMLPAVALCPVKEEDAQPVIDLSSDSEDVPKEVKPHPKPPFHGGSSKSLSIKQTEVETPQTAFGVNSNLAHAFTPNCDSIVDSLKRLSGVHRSRNELSNLNFMATKVQRVNFLPPTYNGDVIFELPPRHRATSSGARNLEGMDKRYDGHPWCKVVTTNIHNNDHLKFRNSSCAGYLACVNPTCDYLKRACIRNESEWSGCATLPFSVGGNPPKDSTLVCKVCKCPPVCVAHCGARIYYVYSEKPDVSRAAIHLGHHGHPVAKGVYRDSASDICALIADEVTKTPSATNSAIALAASKEFLLGYLFHDGIGSKQMLQGSELDEVMDRFQFLSSPSIRNVISSFRSNNRGGVLNNIMTMKKNSRFEFVHDSVFPGQEKEKVYLFKMLTEGPGSGVDLVKRMQVGGDLANGWMMFDHVKRVKDWTTMACHVYDSVYRKVMTIATCDMQSEDTEIQVQFWKSLNVVMARHGIHEPNFKGFMADSAMANWKAVRIVYGSGSAEEKMEDRERTCLLHWSTSLQKHTQKYIKADLQCQHTTLCKQYKDSKSMEEAEIRYLAICSWWLSSGATTEDAIHHLEHWLAFWHFRYRQWGGFMQMV